MRMRILCSLHKDSVTSVDRPGLPGSPSFTSAPNVEISNNEEDRHGAVPIPSVRIPRRVTSDEDFSPLSGGERNNSPLGDVGVNVFAPPSLLATPKLATVKKLKAAMLYSKGKKETNPSVGKWRRTIDTTNTRIQEMSYFVVATNNLVREQTGSVLVGGEDIPQTARQNSLLLDEDHWG